jgi:CRP-like cAMP-binding protein
MPGPHKSLLRNRILSLMPDDDRHFLDRLEPVDLPRTFLLSKLDAPFQYVYFPESGIGSVIVVSPEGNKVEAGLFGRDGFSPVQSLVGASAQGHEVTMQVSGRGHRMTLASFRGAIDASPALANLMMRYAQTLATQVSFTGLSNALHHIDERLARWILMCHDRVDGDEIDLTHDYMSVMLAVRRPSVTTALHVLEGNGLIRSVRGKVIVRNRAALEEFARDAYGTPEAEYRTLIGEMDSSPSKVVVLSA